MNVRSGKTTTICSFNHHLETIHAVSNNRGQAHFSATHKLPCYQSHLLYLNIYVKSVEESNFHGRTFKLRSRSIICPAGEPSSPLLNDTMDPFKKNNASRCSQRPLEVSTKTWTPTVTQFFFIAPSFLRVYFLACAIRFLYRLRSKVSIC